MIQAIIFDFDGVIVETEGPAYQSWREVYEAFHCSIDFHDWSSLIGTTSSHFDPYRSLESQLGWSVDRKEVEALRLQRKHELVKEQPILPGVLDYLTEARQLGIKVGLASSSDYAWVSGNLARLDLLDRFDVIRTNNDVNKAKPEPDLFLSALRALDTAPEHAIAFEDSYNGILSAHNAGIFCVAVPTKMTRDLPLNLADMRVDSLAAKPLKQLIDEVERLKARV
jgi:HAD superfamily hydrolase (TIGR01509 family)